MRSVKVSLIVATVGRDSELQRLLTSLAAQTYTDFEVIVVDQNRDDRAVNVIAQFVDRMTITHLTSPLGVSRARNWGIRKATGEIVGFPDDDCWYPPMLLELLIARFGTTGEYDGVTGRIVNETHSASGDARFDRHSGPVTLSNLWRRACAATVFFTKDTIASVGGFDEELGPGAGTPWGGAEDIDYPARAIKAGRTIFYDPQLCVFHPDLSITAQADEIRRAYSYGAGIGRVWRKQKFPVRIVGYYLLRPLIGAGISLVMGRWMRARYRWAAFQGRLRGLRSH
ncbi:MAG: glycosyltransferase family 2 protein [Nitrospira sp.]|nr:glycosyltransferase family 2 protein [Nitrospira sp.]